MFKLMKNTFSLFLLLSLFYSCISGDSNFTKITPESEITIQVEEVRNEHGMTIFNEKYIIHFASELIGERSEFFKPRNEPIGGYSNLNEWHPLIYDVKVPYKISKLKNDDIIRIIKNNDTLSFKLLEE